MMATILGAPALLGMVDTWMQGRRMGMHMPMQPSSQVVDEYFMWLSFSNSVQQMANKAATVKKKLSALERLEEWLAQINRPLWEATPQDIKTYLNMWACTSGRFQLGNLQLCAPISTRVMASYLATEYDRLPSTNGDWNPLLCTGKLIYMP